MSWQAEVVRFVARNVTRRALARQRDPATARADFERLSARVFAAPPGTLALAGRAGVPGLWVSNRPQGEAVVLYFHGGAYVMGSPRTHTGIAAAIAQRTGARVFLPDFRLAPEHPFPAAFDDAVATYEALVQQGHRPQNIVLGGDSAGGGLALALLGHLCREGRPPAGLFAFSPWTDLTFAGASLVTNASREQVLPAHRLTETRTLILGSARPQDTNDPRLSPLQASFPSAPPVMLHAAQSEILRDDTQRMRGRLPNAEIRIAGDLPHAWPMLHRWLPEARETLDQTAAFIRQCLPPTDES